MSSSRAVTTSGLKASLLILLIIGVFLVGRTVASGISPLAQIIVAMQRISAIAFSDSAELPWLVIVCIGAGLMVIADRRRRARVRQAAC